jgi:hypothetical protein
MPAGAATVDAFLSWWGDHACSYEPGAACTTAGAVKDAIGLAALGVSPAHWPAEDRGVERWILAHPQDWTNVTGLGPGPSLAMTILALEGAGHDPTAVDVDGDRRDLVGELAGHAGPAGYGSPNADAWALFGFNVVGADNETVEQTAQALADAQHASGGWSWTEGEDPDPDTTAWAVTALAPHGKRTADVDEGLVYLRGQQITAGEHRACWPGVGGAASAASTSVALGALEAAAERMDDWRRDGQAPLDCLVGFQQADGSFATAFEAYQTARALGGVPLGWPTTTAPAAGRTGDDASSSPAIGVAATLAALVAVVAVGCRRRAA